ncbi:MAG: tol-pal system protein YbgF [Deltaproteobacteria bacterium]|nr:tol-pal system protein YbgF [Deltaproteobacteria bacterium]
MTQLLKKYPAPLALLILLLTGCGPGFPIMTAEQETLVKNVDRLVADNDSMKARLSALESGSSTAELKKEIEDVKRSLAETNISIEKLRGEMTFVQGSVEEEGHGREGLKESIKSVSSSVASIAERVASVEGSLKGAESDIGTLKGALDVEAKNAAEVREAVASLGKRLSSAEAAPKAPSEPAAARGGEKDAADPDAVYMKGYKETVNKDYTEAAETFRGFLVSYPNHKLASNAQYWLGEIYYARGDWEMAIIEFDKVVKKYPNGEKAAASMLKEGFAFEKLGSKKEARVLLKEVMERFPKTSEAHLAKKRLESLK